MTQSPVTVTYPLEQVLTRIEQKLETLQKDVNDIKIGQTRLEAELKGEIKNLSEDVKELKGSTKNQIWTLIGILS